MKKLLKNILRVAIGIISLPLVIPVSKAFYSQLANISFIDLKNQLWFLYGVAFYVIMHLFFFKPNFFYNLGHEGVHVLSAWISFGKAKNLKVSDQGGSVQTTKSNFFISLSPYFIPIYTIIVILAYFFISKSTDVAAYLPYFIFFIGFTFTMHIVMTAEALRVMQPDLIKTGYLFSLVLIYVLNVLLAGFIISLVFTGFSFVDMIMQFCVETKELYIFISRQLFFV